MHIQFITYAQNKKRIKQKKKRYGFFKLNKIKMAVCIAIISKEVRFFLLI